MKIFNFDKTKSILDKYMTRDYNLFAAQDKAPTKSKLLMIQKRLGIQFPKEFIAHSINQYSGIYIEVKENLWPRPNEFDVGPFWSFLYGLFVYSAGEDAKEFMNLEKCGMEFQKFTNLRAAPFLHVINDADVYCFNDKGLIFRYNHESNELKFVNKSFWEVFEFELKELHERKEKVFLK